MSTGKNQSRRKTCLPGDGPYLPLAKEKLILGKKLTFDIFIGEPGENPGEQEYTLFCEHGTFFSRQANQIIEKRGIFQVYFSQDDKEKVLRYLKWEKLPRSKQLSPDCIPQKRQLVLNETWSVSKSFISDIGGYEYVPMSVDNVWPDWEVPFDSYVKVKIGGDKWPQFIVCCSRDEIFSQALLRKLKVSGIKYIYFKKEDQGRALHYLHRNLGRIFADDNIPAEKKAARVYDATLLWIREFFQAEEGRLGQQIKLGMEFIDSFLELMHQEHYEAGWLLNICQHDRRVYTHALNCSLLGLAFAKYLGWSMGKIKDFGRGALLHDLGMTKIPFNVYNKPGRLSPDEMASIRKHPGIGFRLLRANSPVSRDVLLMVLQHHERGDGSGYPDNLHLPHISTGARILAIIDAYEAMTSSRIWRQKLAPLKALKEMQKQCQETGFFDAQYLTAFIKFLAGL